MPTELPELDPRPDLIQIPRATEIRSYHALEDVTPANPGPESSRQPQPETVSLPTSDDDGHRSESALLPLLENVRTPARNYAYAG